MYSQLQQDSAGNLYGTTLSARRNGSVFELQEKLGAWREKNIHLFGSENDGRNPFGALTAVRDESLLYGTTMNGGLHGSGTIFSLVPSGSGWTENVLYSFDKSDGAQPSARLTRDKASGVLYGTTVDGGTHRCGNVFAFNPTTSQLEVLYTFQGGSDGCASDIELRQGTKPGTLFGATRSAVLRGRVRCFC